MIDEREALEVCSVCGWSCKKVWRFSNNHCAPKRGARAKELLAKLVKLPNVSGQMTGYGFGKLAISIGKEEPKHDKAITLVFDVEDGGTFSVDHTWWHRSDDSRTIEVLITLLSQFHEANP